MPGSSPVLLARVRPDRLQRQIHCHALPTGWEQLEYPTFLERRRTLLAGVVREGFATLWGDKAEPDKIAVSDLIAAGESQTLEFKSSARWNTTQQPDPKLEHVIVKTVCGLLNAGGGVLLIGVADNGEVLGVGPDLTRSASRARTDTNSSSVNCSTQTSPHRPHTPSACDSRR